jgi:hypothetical protein
MRANSKPNVDQSKRDRQRDTGAFAKGGNTRMLGEQAAGLAEPGVTGKRPQSSGPGAKAARGGGKTPSANIGVLVRPAKAGSTAP